MALRPSVPALTNTGVPHMANRHNDPTATGSLVKTATGNAPP
jgi:hypothetical protein